MLRHQNPNLEILSLAVEQLGELADEMVFVGGCATGLLITDAAAPPIRVTRDVDEIKQAEQRLSTELSDRFNGLIDDARFVDAISGHMLTDETSQARVSIILNRIKDIVEIK